MLLDVLVRTLEAVAATRSRLGKVNELADLLLRLDPADIPTAVGLLTVKIRRPNQRGSEDPTIRASYRVESLAELERVLLAVGC